MARADRGRPVAFRGVGFRERLDAFPTQLVLVLVWATAGTAVSVWLKSSILWLALMSVYAIVSNHWTAHTVWKAKREAAEQSG